MSAVVIDGKAVAAKMRAQMGLDVSVYRAKKGTPPGLAVILVGNNPASDVYVRNKIKFSEEIGMDSFERRLPEEITQEQLIDEIHALNKDPLVHGILVQLPLPKHIKEEPVINAVDPKKDVDGFQAINVGKLSLGFSDALIPCTPQGCILLIKEVMPNMSGKHAVVIGRSNIVGKPMAQLLLKENCTVTIAHSKTENLPAIVKQADIVVAAVGQPEMVKADWIKPGAVVIDVGMNRITNADGSTKLVGDVAYAECAEVASAITPVPGGVGPMTIACLLKNTLKAAAQS